jgi:predicted transcriptional regulator of viral defense system
MSKKRTQEEQVLDLINKKRIIRPQDLKKKKIPRTILQRLLQKKKIIRLSRGLYAKPDIAFNENIDLMEISKKIPRGVICLLSALRYHNIGTQLPYKVWIAIDRKAQLPRVERPLVKIVRFSLKSLNYGVETHRVQEVPIRVTNPAKTVVDCFKYRNKIGLDIAIEALKEGWRDSRFSMDELYHAAGVCRVTKIMRPYMEALL